MELARPSGRTAVVLMAPGHHLAPEPFSCSSGPRECPLPVVRVAATSWPYAPSSCPLCQVERHAEAVHLRWFRIENCREPATWLHLREASYCPRHAGLIRRSTGAELSALFDFLTREELAQLRARIARRGRRWPGDRLRRAFRRLLGQPGYRRSGRPSSRPPCPACEAGRVAAEAEAHQLLRLLGSEAGREAYRAGTGLCRRHFAPVVEQAGEALARWLEQDLEARLIRALEEYERYFHLLDYRFRHEPRGREQTAWLRSLLYFWGLPEEADGTGGDAEEATTAHAPRGDGER